MNKKLFLSLALLLALFFGVTKVFAALTFSNNAITGDTSSTIDLGAGHDLIIQDTGGSVQIGTSPGTVLAKLNITGDNLLGSTYPGQVLISESTAQAAGVGGKLVFGYKLKMLVRKHMGHISVQPRQTAQVVTLLETSYLLLDQTT